MFRRGVRRRLIGDERTSITPLVHRRQAARAIRTSQLGLPSATVAKWVRTGRLHPKYRGVYAYGHPQLSLKGECMAAILAAGEGAGLAGMSAAGLLGITRRRAAEIEVVAPIGRRPRNGFRLRTCRNLSPRDIVVVDRIPVTTVALRVREEDLNLRPARVLEQLAAQQLPRRVAGQ